MANPFLKFNHVTFSYDTSVKPLIENLTVHLVRGWTGVVGANGCGKTTLLKLAAGELAPVSGHIQKAGRSIYCPQRTDDLPEKAMAFFISSLRSAKILGDHLRLDVTWLKDWPHISHGMRKRLQIAVALWQEPDLLALDEPFNHLDMEAKRMIGEALEDFPGIGLLVSHDRHLLDDLCNQCLFFSHGTITCRAGGYSKGLSEEEKENLSIKRQLKHKKRARKKLQQEYKLRKERARNADRGLSKSKVSAKDHDAKSRIDMARLSGRDGRAGRLQKQLDVRLNKLDHDLRQGRAAKEYDLGIWLPGFCSNRNYLLDLQSQVIFLGESRLEIPHLYIKPVDRIALTGANGSGKSTLAGKIVDSLNISSSQLLYIPQEITRAASRDLLNQITGLPPESLGRLMTIVSRLNSRPVNLMTSRGPSPGEIRKLMLALGILSQPHMIIMDEPTNHMDLPSTICLEKALQNCPCALLLVSHDRIFLDALTQIRWHIYLSAPGCFQLTVM